MMAMFQKMCDDAGDDGEELRNNLIAEVKRLAERIEELGEGVRSQNTEVRRDGRA